MVPVSQILDCQMLWHRWQEPGIEHLHIREQPSGVLADGCVVGKVDNNLLRVLYQVHADTTYQFQSIQLQMTYPFEQTLQLSRDQDGSWKDATGTHIAILSGCRDIDLSISPFTNTLPIRRLDLAIGQSAEITVAFIELPHLSVRPERQRYMLLQRQGDTSIYRFEHVANNYSVDITVDRNGLVIDYPKLFRRE